MLALSSVIGRSIQSLYPDCAQLKYDVVFNKCIHPRSYFFPNNVDSALYCEEKVNILFCFDGVRNSKIFSPNHFVPAVTSEKNLSNKYN